MYKLIGIKKSPKVCFDKAFVFSLFYTVLRKWQGNEIVQVIYSYSTIDIIF